MRTPKQRWAKRNNAGWFKVIAGRKTIDLIYQNSKDDRDLWRGTNVYIIWQGTRWLMVVVMMILLMTMIQSRHTIIFSPRHKASYVRNSSEFLYSSLLSWYPGVLSACSGCLRPSSSSMVSKYFLLFTARSWVGSSQETVTNTGQGSHLPVSLLSWGCGYLCVTKHFSRDDKISIQPPCLTVCENPVTIPFL